MQQQLNLQRESTREISREFIEEKRPRIQIVVTRVDIVDTGLVVYVDFDNVGFADAEDVFTFFVIKSVDSPQETLSVKIANVHKITSSRGLNQVYELRAAKGTDLTCHVGITYTWRIKNLFYFDQKFFGFSYQEKPEKYRIHLLLQRDIQKLWQWSVPDPLPDSLVFREK